MAKRARRAHDDSDYSEDPASDASFAPAAKRARSRPSKKQPTKKAKTLEGRFDGATVEEPGHPASRHRLTDAAPLRDALLGWYAGVHAARGMPWRVPFDAAWGPAERAQRAYEVWVSEIMLQQTQVATVIPYYDRWMARFPTLDDLAASDLETVNALWKGLGYYSRAARLLQGARKAVEELGGRLPDNAGDMEAQIPGIGRYSAGAICSIAYNECAPVLDGNVHRLLSRVLALYAPPKAKQSLDVLWAAAAAVVEGAHRPGDVNQALIELGSTVCRVREPLCEACPLQAWCGARRRAKDAKPPAPALADIEDLCTACEPLPADGAVTVFPMKAARKKPREELDVVHVVEWRDARTQDRWFLLTRRPEGGLLAGLHEFPTDASASATTHEVLARVLAHPPAEGRVQVEEEGLRIVHVKPAGDVVHVFSHIRKTYRVQWVLLAGGPSLPPLLSSSTTTTSPSQPKAKAKSKTRTTTDAVAPSAMWTRLADVADANVGTGVLKVWRQACALWD